MLEVRGFAKGFGTEPLFQSIDLEVARGEWVAIVGESGSGKSTFARCVARLIDPTEGAILIEN